MSQLAYPCVQGTLTHCWVEQPSSGLVADETALALAIVTQGTLLTEIVLAPEGAVKQTQTQPARIRLALKSWCPFNTFRRTTGYWSCFQPTFSRHF